MREIEIKCKLRKSPGEFIRLMESLGYGRPNKVIQKNHYFAPAGNPSNLKNLSVRTRQTGKSSPQLVIKLGADPINGRDRIEKTSNMHMFSTIAQLDEVLVTTGLVVPHSKWGRVRRNFYATHPGVKICLDLNVGYGWLVELEADDGVSEETLENFADNINLDILSDSELDYMYQQVMANNEYFYEQFWKYGAGGAFCNRWSKADLGSNI